MLYASNLSFRARIKASEKMILRRFYLIILKVQRMNAELYAKNVTVSHARWDSKE